jgi:cytochrome b6-f complex iron-sulfur subunit
MTDPGNATSGVSRREVLNYAWLASLGILFTQVAGVSYLFSMPRFKEGEFGGVFVLGTSDTLPAAGGPPQNYPEGKFWLVNQNDEVQALYKVCTHLDCLYSWDDQERRFVCPCHGSQFCRRRDLFIRSGAALA